jgi:hypothetical protein
MPEYNESQFDFEQRLRRTLNIKYLYTWTQFTSGWRTWYSKSYATKGPDVIGVYNHDYEVGTCTGTH